MECRKKAKQKMVEVLVRPPYNNRIQLTVKSVTFFAKQKAAPLFTSADAGVMFSQKTHHYLAS
jgi:hypothetical protein